MRGTCFTSEPLFEPGQEKPALGSRGRKSTSITLFILSITLFPGFLSWSARGRTTRRAIRGLSQSTGWKWRTKVESPLARRANLVFADARARVLLHSHL